MNYMHVFPCITIFQADIMLRHYFGTFMRVLGTLVFILFVIFAAEPGGHVSKCKTLRKMHLPAGILYTNHRIQGQGWFQVV